MVWKRNYLRYLDDSTYLNRLKYCSWFLCSHFYLLLGYKARTLSILEYGRVIREYDPYFNLRATEYLYKNGIRKFFTWMDDKSWYPLGMSLNLDHFPDSRNIAFTYLHLFVFFFRKTSRNHYLSWCADCDLHDQNVYRCSLQML